MKKIIFLLIFIAFTYAMNATLAVVADSNTAAQEVPLPPPHMDHYQAKIDVDDEVPNIAYVMPIAFFVFVLLIIGIAQYFNYKKNKDRMELYIKYLEHGKEVPADLLIQPKDVSSNLKRGVIFIAVGLGLTIFFFAESPKSTEFTIGLIPLLIGIGYLIVYKLSQRPEVKPNE